MDKALLDTDMFSEILKGIDQRVVAKAVAYRAAFGRYTIILAELETPESTTGS